jgi:hypothetical protein
MSDSIRELAWMTTREFLLWPDHRSRRDDSVDLHGIRMCEMEPCARRLLHLNRVPSWVISQRPCLDEKLANTPMFPVVFPDDGWR